jgi:hypothetical protein
VLFNQLVDFVVAVSSYAKQIVSKAARLVVHCPTLTPKRMPHLVIILLAHVGLEKHLQQQFAGFAARTHAALSIQQSAFSLQDVVQDFG